MSDPVSIAGTALSIVSLGIQITNSLLQYYNSYKDYESDTRLTRGRLATLNQNLLLIKLHVQNAKVEPIVQKQVEECIGSCDSSIGVLAQKLKKFSHAESGTSPVVKGRIKRKLEKVVYPFRESTLAKIRENVAGAQANVDTALEILQIDAIREANAGITWLVDEQKKSNRSDILEWISSQNYHAQSRDMLKSHTPESGDWFLHSTTFKSWKARDCRTLFCPGIPGAGKTVMACKVLEHMNSEYGQRIDVGLCFSLCDYKKTSEFPFESHLATFLEQLSRHFQELPQCVTKLYEQNEELGTSPSESELLETLVSVGKLFQTVYIIIDALDETSERQGARLKFVDSILDLRQKLGASLFTTSRFNQEIQDCFNGEDTIEIRADPNDVRRCIDNRINDLPRFVQRDQELKAELIHAIMQAHDGMFLLVKLILDSLKDITTKTAFRSAIYELKKGQSALQNFYRDAEARIKAQSPHSISLARKALSWIICATRRLSTTELQYALAITDSSKFDTDAVPDVALVLSVCAGLVTHDEESQIVRVVHHTTEEYFKSEEQDLLQDENFHLLQICLWQLSYSDLHVKPLEYITEREARHRRYPFLRYAANEWPVHAARCTFEVTSTEGSSPSSVVADFLCDPKNLQHVISNCNRLLGTLWIDEDDHALSAAAESGISALHVATLFNLGEVLSLLIERSTRMQPLDLYGSSPLLWAVTLGRTNIVRILVEQLPTALEDEYQLSRTLEAAAFTGSNMVREILLSIHAQRLPPGSLSSSLPAIAAHCGSVLLETVLNRITCARSNLPILAKSLRAAAGAGMQQNVRLLADYVNDIDAVGPTYSWYTIGTSSGTPVPLIREHILPASTALHLAISQSHIETAQLLLDMGANIFRRAVLHKCASDAAISTHSPSMLKFVLESGGSISSQSVERQFKFTHLLTKKHSSIEELLDEYRDRIDAHNIDYLKLIRAQYNHIQVLASTHSSDLIPHIVQRIRWLLDLAKYYSINIRFTCTILLPSAARLGLQSTVLDLIEHGARINNSKGYSHAMTRAVLGTVGPSLNDIRDQEAILYALLSAGAKIDPSKPLLAVEVQRIILANDVLTNNDWYHEVFDGVQGFEDVMDGLRQWDNILDTFDEESRAILFSD